MMIYQSVILILVFQIAFHEFIYINGLEDDANRPPSLFKVDDSDEWVALPEVFSKLDFSANDTFASDNDIPGQLKLRSTRYWGRLYIDGWPQTIQFYRAHFGNEPPLGRKIFTFVEPR